MQGDPREPLEENLLISLEAMAWVNGYDLPDEFRLITREVLDVSQFAGNPDLLPACVLLMLDNDPTEKLSHVVEEWLHGQVILFFEPTYLLAASVANRYRSAIKQALTADLRRGGVADHTRITSAPPAGLWEGTGLLALVVGFSVLVEYDMRLPALIA